MITPQKIQDLADPIESIYIHMVDELLVNIGRHITSPTWTHTASWEIAKLAELGQLTQENAEIINAWIKQMPQEIRDTMEATRAAALDRLEKQLEQAAKDGYIPPPITDTSVSVLRDLAQQAADRMNLVNTTMLQSSVDQFTRAVQLTAEEYERLMAQQSATQGILNEAAASVASGTETRLQAMRRAITLISDEGLTGFIDRAGRHWSPEAYINMDIRTTVHNAAIESTKARMQDYNTQVFQVSSHAGARPGCYPYQGKYYSWDNTAGDVPLGNGAVVRYEPLNSTTYGQAAGLFGINCGHFPIPIIPGVTIPHGADNIQPKEENGREYAESQEQRAIERQIREAKRNVEMLGDAATKEDKAKVRELQAKMREFTERTGRARRYDRESIGGTRQTSRTPATPERPVIQRPAAATAVQQITPPSFTPAKTIQEAEEFAQQFVDTRKNFAAPGVHYDGVDIGVANRVNKTLWDFYNEFDVQKFGGVVAPKANSREGRMIQNATAAYSPVQNSFFLNRKSLKTEKAAEKSFAEERRLAVDLLTHPEKYDLSKGSSLFRKVVEAAKTSGRTTVPENIEEAVWHELGHSLEKPLRRLESYKRIKDRMYAYAENVSGYATTEVSEYIAESFASWKKGESVADPVLIEAFISLRRKSNG